MKQYQCSLKPFSLHFHQWSWYLRVQRMLLKPTCPILWPMIDHTVNLSNQLPLSISSLPTSPLYLFLTERVLLINFDLLFMFSRRNISWTHQAKSVNLTFLTQVHSVNNVHSVCGFPGHSARLLGKQIHMAVKMTKGKFTTSVSKKGSKQ